MDFRYEGYKLMICFQFTDSILWIFWALPSLTEILSELWNYELWTMKSIYVVVHTDLELKFAKFFLMIHDLPQRAWHKWRVLTHFQHVGIGLNDTPLVMGVPRGTPWAHCSTTKLFPPCSQYWPTRGCHSWCSQGELRN